MNKLILCEGETDAVLLSYYLGKVAGWEYGKKAPNGLNIKTDGENQSVNWYQKNNDYLLICAVGGKDNFKNCNRSRKIRISMESRVSTIRGSVELPKNFANSEKQAVDVFLTF